MRRARSFVIQSVISASSAWLVCLLFWGVGGAEPETHAQAQVWKDIVIVYIYAGDVSQIPTSSVTPVIYGHVTSAQVSPHEFWPLYLYSAEPRFVRLNVTVRLATSDRGSGAVVGLYARRGTFPSHTRYDIFHAVDVDQLSSLASTVNGRSRRRATSNVSTLLPVFYKPMEAFILATNIC